MTTPPRFFVLKVLKPFTRRVERGPSYAYFYDFRVGCLGEDDTNTGWRVVRSYREAHLFHTLRDARKIIKYLTTNGGRHTLILTDANDSPLVSLDGYIGVLEYQSQVVTLHASDDEVRTSGNKMMETHRAALDRLGR